MAAGRRATEFCDDGGTVTLIVGAAEKDHPCMWTITCEPSGGWHSGRPFPCQSLRMADLWSPNQMLWGGRRGHGIIVAW